MESLKNCFTDEVQSLQKMSQTKDAEIDCLYSQVEKSEGEERSFASVSMFKDLNVHVTNH